MAKHSVHFAVGRPDGPRSSEWVVVASGGDVYVTGAGLGSTIKVSLHESGQWQSAFVREFFDRKPDWLEAQTRAMSRWLRPPPLGANVALAFRLLVPVSELDTWEDSRAASDVRWVAPPDEGLVEFQVWIRTGSKASEDDWPGKNGRGTQLLGELPLGGADTVVVTYLFEPPSVHIQRQLHAMAHIVSRLGPEYESRRGVWKPGLRGFVEATISDGSVAWLEFAEPSNRPLPDLSPDDTADLATELVKVRRFEDAIELFDQALDAQPSLVTAQYNRACALMLAGRTDAARKALAELAAGPAKHVEPLLNYSAVLLSQGWNDEAADVLARATAAFPTHAATWHNYGTALRRIGREREVQHAFPRALSLDPRDASTAMEIAKGLVRRGQHKHAAAELRAVLRHSTSEGKVREMLASLLVQLRQTDEGLAVLDAAVWTGASVEGRFSRAWALAEEGDYEAAISSMDAYLAGKRLDEATTSQALWFLRIAKPRQALDLCEARVRAESDSSFLHAVAGLAALEQGMPRRALELAEAAVRLEESSVAVGVLARALLETGDTERALDSATRAFDLDCDNPDASAVAALALLRTSPDADEAWRHLDSALASGWEDCNFFTRDETFNGRLARGLVPEHIAAWVTEPHSNGGG